MKEFLNFSLAYKGHTIFDSCTSNNKMSKFQRHFSDFLKIMQKSYFSVIFHIKKSF